MKKIRKDKLDKAVDNIRTFFAAQYVWDIHKSTRRKIEEAIMRRKFDWGRATSIGVDYIETEKGAWKK